MKHGRLEVQCILLMIIFIIPCRPGQLSLYGVMITAHTYYHTPGNFIMQYGEIRDGRLPHTLYHTLWHEKPGFHYICHDLFAKGHGLVAIRARDNKFPKIGHPAYTDNKG